MSLFKKVKENKNFVWIFLFIILIGFFGFLNLRILEKNKKSNRKLKMLEAKVNNLEKEKQKYLKQINEAQKKSFLLEKIREDFGKKRPGEKVAAFDFEKKISPEAGKKKEQQKGFFEKILEKIGIK